MERDEGGPERGPVGPTRPLVWLAGTLGIGTWLGLASDEGARLVAGSAVLALALLAAAGARRAHGPRWVAPLLLLAFARASAMGEPAPRARALTALEAAPLRDAPIVGRWRARADGRTGWVEPFDGEPEQGGHALLLEPELGPPEDGTPVAILPGSEVIPWPRGPSLASGSRSRRFAAWSPVSVDELVRLGPAPQPPWIRAMGGALARLRSVVGARAASVEGQRSAGLLRALAIGARDDLAPERVELFARTGTSHLLAISGWHVSLFAALVILPLARATPRARRAVAWIAARGLLLVLFAALAGAAKPVLRATLATVLHELAALRPAGASTPPRRPDTLSFLGAAFALECLFDPVGIRSLSLALSYAATLGLVVGTGPLARALRPTPAPWSELVPRGPLRILGARLAATFWSGLAASLSAVLATLPFVWSAFGEFAPAGPLLTLAALVPFTWLSLVAWGAALAPCALWTPLAELGAALLYGLLELGDVLPGTPLLLPPRPALLLALASTLVFVGLHRPAALRAGALLFGVLLLPWRAAPRGLELVALDVGHGSALVVRAPGLEALVFDAGSRDRRALAGEALLPLLAEWEAAHVEVVLSHPHQDHASGLARLAGRLPITRWLGAFPQGAHPAQRFVRDPHLRDAHPAGAQDPHDPYAPALWAPLALVEPLPTRLDLGPGRLEGPGSRAPLRWALLRGSAEAGNEGSRALELTWRGQRILLLGDAEEAGLDGLELAPGPLRLLLAPHHGSEARGLRRLLERCPPEEVWISASELPRIGAELTRRGLPWRWTGRDGPLALHLP